MSKKTMFVALWGLLVGGAALHASPIVVDGDLSDWGYGVSDGNTSAYAPLPAIGLVGNYTEDQDDFAGDGGYLGPNSGGQNYDAESLSAAVQGNTLYIALTTGQRPDNGLIRYAPGDLRIETSSGTYGLEIGGGVGGGDGSVVTEGDTGSTYVLQNNGYTDTYTDAAPAQVAGSLWTGVDWVLDPIAPHEPTQFEINPTSMLRGMSDYVFTRDTVTAEHAVVELALDLNLFAGETIEHLYWRPSCGNDEVNLDVNIVPEPSSLALLALVGLALPRRRRA